MTYNLLPWKHMEGSMFLRINTKKLVDLEYMTESIEKYIQKHNIQMQIHTASFHLEKQQVVVVVAHKRTLEQVSKDFSQHKKGKTK